MTQNSTSKRPTYDPATRAWIARQAQAVLARRRVEPLRFPSKPAEPTR